MGTKVLVFYGAEDRLIRRVVVHDFDSSANSARPGGGEGLRVISKAFYQRHHSHADLAASLGLVG